MAIGGYFKKLKHEPSLKKPWDFTVAEGHGHPLVLLMAIGGYFINGYW